MERVVRIHDLVFIEGLTLSGVRRRFESEQPPPQDDLFAFVAEVQAAQAKAAQTHADRRPSDEDDPVVAPVASDEVAPRVMPASGRTAPAVPAPAAAAAPGIPEEARSALVQLKQEMRSLLDLLGGDGAAAPASVPKRSRRG